MLANYGQDKVQKHKIGTTLVGETSPEVVSPNGETSMSQYCPKIGEIVRKQVKHKNSGVKTSRSRRPRIANPFVVGHASYLQEVALQQ